jgi:putative two-component system response regulator
VTQVLVIDDEPAVRGLMVAILGRAGYDAVEADSASRALELLDDPGLALVVSDIVMPGLSGFELLDEVRARRPSLPVLFVTGSGTQDNLVEALAHGAAGLITKPFSHAELREQVASVLSRARRGERELRERVIPPALARVLTQAITARDLTTGGHTDRLADLSAFLGRELGLSAQELELVRLGASLHDIGKIGIPDGILLKEGGLEPDERMLMQTHTLIGDRLLESVPELEGARPVVRSHHERWDGSGYPDRLAGEEIPFAARLVAVADGIEAMSSHRPYRGPLPPAEILRELREGSGTQWDPAIVAAAVDLVERGEILFGPECLRLPSVEAAA